MVAMVADGMTTDEIIAELPDLTLEDVREALRYAAEAVREREQPVTTRYIYATTACREQLTPLCSGKPATRRESLSQRTPTSGQSWPARRPTAHHCW